MQKVREHYAFNNGSEAYRFIGSGIDLGLCGEPAAHIRFPLAPFDWLRLQEPVRPLPVSA